ncbi:MAG: Fur family transcriptional regulator [Propionibacteriaceae bacterium]|nr:Fur family transcriptional regulator [Propionibacteriaceae bacterium]
MGVEQDSDQLRAAGLRVTGPRLATMQIVRERPHATADAVASAVRERLGSVSKQAIYDILHALTDAQLLRRVAVDGRGSQYELERHDNHHHIVCRDCGRLEDVPCPVGTPPCLDPPVDHGFAVEEAEVIYRGLCSVCRSRTKSDN